MDCRKIGEYIQAKRKAVGLTQEQLGDMLGITSKAVSKWECGVAIPDVSLFSELANILHIDISELLNGEDNVKVSEDKKKNKIIIILIIVISLLIIIIIVLGIYFKSNYSKVKVYDLVSATDSFYVDGKLISVDDKNYLTISKVEYFGEDADSLVYIYDYECELYYDENLIYKSEEIEKDKTRSLMVEKSLKNIFSSIVISCEDHNLFSLNNNAYSEFNLRIRYIDFEGNLEKIDVILKVNN